MVGPLKIFAAVAPPEEVRRALADQLSELAVPGRLVPPQNWHITLRYLGDVDEITLDRFNAGLDQSALGRSFMMSLTGLAAFPNTRKATVVWARSGRGELRLHQLAEVCDEVADSSGVAPEDRPFVPHLTVSRVRPPADVSPLVHESELDISWRVSAVTLFESRSERGGVRYNPLETFELAR